MCSNRGFNSQLLVYSADLASISSFAPYEPFIESSLKLASVHGAITDYNAYLRLHWDFPAAMEQVFKCEANGMNIHGHSVKYESFVKIEPAGQLSPTHMLRELQKLGATNTEIVDTNKHLKTEISELMKQAFEPYREHGNSHYYQARVSTV